MSALPTILIPMDRPRVDQVLEDMLRMYVMDKPTKWEGYLPLVEFAYNNG